MNRRTFLSLVGLGAAAAGVELVAPEPVRRYWQVGRGAPVPTRGPTRGPTCWFEPNDWVTDHPGLREWLGPRAAAQAERAAERAANPLMLGTVDDSGNVAWKRVPEPADGQPHLFGIEADNFPDWKRATFAVDMPTLREWLGPKVA